MDILKSLWTNVKGWNRLKRPLFRNWRLSLDSRGKVGRLWFLTHLFRTKLGQSEHEVRVTKGRGRTRSQGSRQFTTTDYGWNISVTVVIFTYYG